MPNHSFSRRIMVVMTLAAVALGGIALPAAAKGAPAGRGKPAAAEAVSAKGKAKGKATAEARKAAAKARQAAVKARFFAVGSVTAVGAADVTVQVKSANRKALRGTEAPVVFTVAEGAIVKLNGVPVTLDLLAVGDRVKVRGVTVDGVRVARRIIASREEEEVIDDGTGTEDGTIDDGTIDDGTGTEDGTLDDGTGTDDGTLDDGTTTP